ncbi:MAG: hypothetical protein ACW98I_19125 [Candidatus Hodarchaeales archaeon]|jgi:hypothetical protein
MQDNTSNLRICGPGLPEAIEKLKELEKKVIDLLPIEKGVVNIGSYDYIFYWKEPPTPEPLLTLIRHIDDTFTGGTARYSITTEGYYIRRLTAEIDRRALNTIFSFIRIQGPSLTKALKAIESVVDEVENANTLESLKSSVLVGEWDYAFEWDHYPSLEEIHDLLSAIDKLVAPTGAKYTITTKKNVYRTEKIIDDHTSDNLMAFL